MASSSLPLHDSPVTINHLPLELKFQVVELLYDSYGAGVSPILNETAAWSNPYGHIGILKEHPDLEREESTDLNYQNSQPGAAIPASPLKALRLVSKEYYGICTPMVYRQLALDNTGWNPLQRLEGILANPFGKYVRRIRIYLHDEKRGEDWVCVVEAIARIIAQCINANAIAMYYEDGTERDFGNIRDEIIRMIAAGKVTQFGIYSARILRAKRTSRRWRLRSYSSPMRMLYAILLSPRVCQALRRLDIVLEELSTECFQLLRRNASSLQSLTIRKTLRIRQLSQIWNPGETYWWSTSMNLTSLKFIGCQRPGAHHMVSLMPSFPALKELVWATSGTNGEPIPPLPEAGWSRDPSSLPNMRPPLDLLHIEHGLTWELCWLGLIPAKTVLVAHSDENRLVNAMGRDIEMFLGIIQLQVPPWSTDPVESDDGVWAPAFEAITIGAVDASDLPSKLHLEAICEKQGISLTRDAVSLDVYRKGRKCCHKCYVDISSFE